MHNTFKSIKPRTMALIKRFKQEVAGVAAIEFAIIAPIMILLFFATIEVSTALSVDRKLARVSSTLGDLITQSQTLTQADLDNIMDAASFVMTPYDHTLGIIVTQISISSGAATVDWSRAYGTGIALAPNTPYTVPAKIMDDDTYLVSAKVIATHTPLYAKTTLEGGTTLKIDKSSSADINMEEEIFLRPRIGLKTNIQ
ncbi:MAG: pilus assembly protein [Rhizobiaceae bacterium]